MHIPTDILIHNIAKHLDNPSKLALAMSCKNLYSSFFHLYPSFKTQYTQKHQCAMCIQRMLQFIRSGPTAVASCTLLLGTCSIIFIRSNKTTYIVPNEHVPDVFTWFDKNMWRKRKAIQLSTMCLYKKPHKRQEFMQLTNDLIKVLSC